jgi:hypothetical protein
LVGICRPLTHFLLTVVDILRLGVSSRLETTSWARHG